MKSGNQGGKENDLEQLFADVEVLAERARLGGYPKLRSGLLSVAVLTLVGLEDEAIRVLSPLVAKADARARELLGAFFPFPGGED